MNTLEKKQIELTNIITMGLFYYPVITWGNNGDEGDYSPYIDYKEKEEKMFDDIPELIKAIRDLADSLEKQNVSHSDEEHYLTGWDD